MITRYNHKGDYKGQPQRWVQGRITMVNARCDHKGEYKLQSQGEYNPPSKSGMITWYHLQSTLNTYLRMLYACVQYSEQEHCSNRSILNTSWHSELSPYCVAWKHLNIFFFFRMPCWHIRVWVPVPMFLHAWRNLPSRGWHLQLFQWLDGRGLWNEYVQFFTKAWWLVQAEGWNGGGGGLELGQVHYQSSLLLWLLLVNKSEFLLFVKPKSVPAFHICFLTHCNGRGRWCFRLPGALSIKFIIMVIMS